jgi:hypothetical protein
MDIISPLFYLLFGNLINYAGLSLFLLEIALIRERLRIIYSVTDLSLIMKSN